MISTSSSENWLNSICCTSSSLLLQRLTPFHSIIWSPGNCCCCCFYVFWGHAGICWDGYLGHRDVYCRSCAPRIGASYMFSHMAPTFMHLIHKVHPATLKDFSHESAGCYNALIHLVIHVLHRLAAKNSYSNSITFVGFLGERCSRISARQWWRESQWGTESAIESRWYNVRFRHLN